jgi:hypothetical protein
MVKCYITSVEASNLKDNIEEGQGIQINFYNWNHHAKTIYNYSSNILPSSKYKHFQQMI